MLQTITHLQYWHHLIHLVSTHLQINQGTIRVLLKNRNISRQTETGMYYISLQNVNQQIKAELFYLFLMKISCFKKNDSQNNGNLLAATI